MARRTSLVAIAILAVVVPLLGVGAAEAAPGSTLLIGFRPSSASFSPNGDGRRDTATAHYTLTATARVYARVVDRDGNTIRSFRPGRLSKGVHELRWDGVRTGGAVVDDGFYRIIFRAVRGSTSVQAPWWVSVDTDPPSEPITFNRTSVYPATKVFADAVRFKFPIKTTARAAVRRPDGSLVRRLSLRKVACNPDLPIRTGNVCTLTGWNGRDARGRVVAPGRYVLRSVMADPAGNRRISHTRLTVSAKPLVERTRTTTVAAAELAAATRTPCGYYPGAPEGCDDTWCPPVASDRFPGGLSFRSGPGCRSYTGNSALRYYAATGETGHEQFRVTATGGPTTPGATDHATLPGGTTIQGDSTARSPWIPVERAPSEVGGRREWSVSTGDGNRYDIASFTIETTYFAPAP